MKGVAMGWYFLCEARPFLGHVYILHSISVIHASIRIPSYCAPWMSRFEYYSFHPYSLTVDETMYEETPLGWNIWSIRLLVVEGELVPMLDWHISECMVTIINMNNGIKGLTRGYHHCNTSQIS